MKFLVVLAFLAVAAAEETRVRRSAVFGYGGFGGSVKGVSAVVSGPSGVIHADTGAVASGAAGHGYVAAPAVVAAAAPAFVGAGYHTPTVYAGPAQTAGAIVSPGATLVGPSTDGRPGVVAANGYYGHGYGGYPYGSGPYHGGYYGNHGYLYG
ncbi:UNVERIFIED_CONTAM: hypothetical protein PYX00_009523 [Menopon gallinae]|uniref:Uncharacterized protein n=1 Tax=Menopon gallinae TaxID=328185 RepID=A0AAW2HBX0_9NEOP